MSASSEKTTASQKELIKFAAIAKRWWDPTGPFSQLHKINPIRLKFILERAQSHFKTNFKLKSSLKGLKILDIGCGGGLLCEPLTRLGAYVTGIDAEEKNLIAAREHAKKIGLEINYIPTVPERLALEKTKYDIVLNMEIVEHTENVNLLLEASTSLVKPGGFIVISTLNRTINSLLFGIFAAEYILGWVPVGTHNWNRFIRPNELDKKLNNLGLKIEKFSGMTYKISDDSWSLSDDLSVNYLAFCKK